MAIKDIEKLKEKFEKDRNSKLFLPLAEEYRKEGMLDEAIEVLTGGIGRHSTYTSARVLLGKIYLEKGMLDEARSEFENVVKTVPDNLYAYKKLAEIYRDTGESELAIKAYRSILKLSPMDEETISNLKDIEVVSTAVAPGVKQKKEPPLSEELRMPPADMEDVVSGAPADMHEYEDLSIESPPAQGQHSDEGLDAFKDSLFGDTAAGLGEEIESLEELPEGLEETDQIAISDEDIAVAADEEGFSFKDVDELVRDASGPDQGGPVLPEDEADETIELVEEYDEHSEDRQVMLKDEPETIKKVAFGVSDGDRLVAEGKFFEAMSVYRQFLTSDPRDKTVLQRVEELRSLLKLMGKDKEVLIAKLDAFLSGITKRRDEFFGRS